MGELIKLQQESKPPLIICPHCKKEVNIDITPFSKDVSKILRDKCTKCGGEIHVGVLILSHPRLDGILGAINNCVMAMGKGNVLLQ
jgi:hypothetical protein